ncbi:MAG: hypothetical protein EBS82_04335 [Methylocystaceae bacterium]|nr:hypothetical protein [Methylocystaceae bacterium]NBT96965.1 hypothetical protein [Methylocystaceae bacterium]
MTDFDPKAVLAIVSTPEQLRKALALRRHELGLKQLELDEMSGCQSGYTGKIEAGIKNLGPVSMPAILEALGLEMVLMRSTRAHGNLQAITRSCSVILKKDRSDKGRKGGLTTRERLSPLERSLLASRAAQSRWRKSKSKRKVKTSKR